MLSNSPIIEFYAGISPDRQGRKLEEIWQQDHQWLEKTHDYIQWLFPLRDKSRFNPHAPILTEIDIQTFKDHQDLKLRLEHSFKLMLAFYGLKLQTTVILAESFSERKQQWLHWGNHNHMRITRILKSLQLLGLEPHAQLFFNCLEQIYSTEKGAITNLTFSYWRDAVMVQPNSPTK